MNDTVQRVAEFPRDHVFSTLVVRMLEIIEAQGITPRNLTTGQGTKNVRIVPNYEGAITSIFNMVANEEFGFTHDDLILMRAVKDNARLGVTDKFYEMCNVLDVLLPRYNARNAGQQPEPSFATPLMNEPVLTIDEIVKMFVNENFTYIRKRLSQVCLEMNTSIIPRPEDNEVEDLEMAEGDWLVKQNSMEGVTLAAALNYSTVELAATNLPRFNYISKAMGPLREIADNSPRSKNQALSYATGAANALFVYMSAQRPDDSDIEAGHLLDKYRSFRVNVGWHRETAISVLSRLNNGKPAYKDLTNLAKRYYGIHFWGLDTLIRQTVPMLKLMYEDPTTRPELVKWLDSCGVLEIYEGHKRFHRAHQAAK